MRALTRIGWWVAGWLAWGGWLAAQDFRLQDVVTVGDALRVRFAADTNHYYLLLKGTRVQGAFLPADAALGLAGIQSFAEARPADGAGFYRVRRVPIGQPVDTDEDGIDDVYELRTPGLSPLVGLDAQLEAPGAGGLTFLQVYQRAQAPPATLSSSSPYAGEGGVAVTRETVVHFTRPLSPGAVLTTSNFYASFGGRRLLSRVEVSSDRWKASLFPLENLPASARIRVTLVGDGVPDVNGRDLDADGDGRPGGAGTLDFDTLTITPVGLTAVVGRVFASDPVPDGSGGFTNRPLRNVTITVDGAEESLRTTTDADGFFRLQPAPAGRFFVHVDGRTADGSQWPNGAYYPFVGKAWEAEAGRTNNLASGTGEIFLPLIPAGALQAVNPTNRTEVTFIPEVLAANPALEGVRIEVPAGSLFSDEGRRGGRVGIAPVAPDRLPEPLPPGLNLPLVITIQTDGPSNFDRPVPVRFPNLPDPATGELLEPGAKSALWSFDHDKGRWEIVGPMTVSADGRFVETDPGVGVLQPGWHGTQPGSQMENEYGPSPLSPYGPGLKAGFSFGKTMWTFLGVAADLAGAEVLGKFSSAVNLVVDTATFLQEPSLKGAGKILLDAGGIWAPPGARTAIRGVSLLVSGGEFTQDAGNFVNSMQQAQNAPFDPFAGQGTPRRLAALAAPGVAAAQVPRVWYRARDWVDRPAQDAAFAALMEEYRRATNIYLTQTEPQYRELDRLFDVTEPLVRRAQANPEPPLTAAELDQVRTQAVALTNVIADIDATPGITELSVGLAGKGADYQRVLFENLAMLSVGSTLAPIGSDGRRALLQAFGAQGVRRRLPYRVVGLDTDLRGRTGENGDFNFIVRPNGVYQLSVLDPETGLVCSALFRSGRNGERVKLPPLLLVEDSSSDADGDGLGEYSEGILGTRVNVADSDGDGVNDLAELRAGTNPLDNQPAIVGMVAGLATPTRLVDIAASGDLAAGALGTAGVGIYQIRQRANPTEVARVDTPGSVRRVAIEGARVAAADADGGLVLIDASDEAGARVVARVELDSAVWSVTTAAGVAYAGTVGGQICAVDLSTGVVIGRLAVGTPVHDLAWAGNTLVVAGGNRLLTVQLAESELTLVGAVNLSLFPEGITGQRRVSVGDGVAYVTAYPGYSVVDISSPSSPVVVGAPVDNGPNSFKQIVPTGSFLGVAAVGVNPREDGTHDVYLYDLSDPTVTTNLLVQLPTPGLTYAVAVHRGLALVADGAQGLGILNFRNPDARTNAPLVRLETSFPAGPAGAAGAEQGTFAAVTAEATDDVLVREVEFYLDGVLVETDGGYPFEHRFVVPVLSATKTRFTLQARAIDTDGNATWSELLTVGIGPDRTGPRANPFGPAAAGFAVNVTRLGVWYSEPMDPATVDTNAVQLVGLGPDRQPGTADDVPVVGTVVFDPERRTAEFQVAEPLAAGRYLARATRSARDLAGNPLRTEVVWGFEAWVGADADQDGLTDEFETAFGLQPGVADENRNGVLDAADDFDGDGLSNGLEMALGTNPRNQRTFDGRLDSQLDRDGDFLPDFREFGVGTDWNHPDTDRDGWNDEIEVNTGANPLVPNAYLPGIFLAGQQAWGLRMGGSSALGMGTVHSDSWQNILVLGADSPTKSNEEVSVLVNGSFDGRGQGVYLADPPVRIEPETFP